MYAFRQAELVGKRFLCVREKNSLRPNSRSSRVSNPLGYQWKVGVIRACSEKDFHHPEIKVLVEYDNEDWTTREWLTIYDGSWKIFLVEKAMVWSQRPDPSNPRRLLLWPALTFSPLVDKHGLSDEERPVPVEFVGDHERMFVRSEECRPYGQDDDALQPALRNNPSVMEELRNWQRVQKSQSILLDGPFTLTGFRVQVYRQTCRQWYSAVITGHDLMSRELSCMDDTVLQTHRVDPRLSQVILLANETELDSLLRGELVRVLPMRQHRHSQVIITAPLTTQTTSNSFSSAAPTTWQLYAGLTHSTNSNNHLQAVSSTQAVFSSPAVSTITNRHVVTHSPPNIPSASTSKERRKSSESRNRSSASRRVTRSDSINSPTVSSDTQQRTPQTIQSPITTPSATPVPSIARSVSHTSSQQSHKTSPPDTHAMSPKNSSSSSSVGSPSSSLQKRSPTKQPMSPKTSSSMLQYSSSPSKAGMSSMGSPFRSNPFCSSPDMSSVVSMASPMSAMSHMGMCSPGHMGYSRAQSPHPLYSHGMGHLNISPTQLYALQLQQQQKQMLSPEQQAFLSKLQHQHYQSLLHQYQMHHYQLQLMLQQQELIRQMPLTVEQQHILAEHYNQLLHQYQCAQIFQQLATVTQDEQLSMLHGTDDRTQVLPERIQQQLREAQERQKQELQNLMPRLEPEQLQTFFTCLQQRSMSSDQIADLYSLLIQQQEAQKRQPQEDEQQKIKIQEYLRQNQEHVQKILQLQQSPSRSRDAEHKEEPKLKQETSSSSSQRESPSSTSSFTVHYMPTLSDSGASSDANGKDKSGSDASESSKPKARPDVGEIELKSITTEEERSGSQDAILEKLFQHHLEAVKESKQQASAKTRRPRASSTEKRSKRQRKSAESSSTRVQDKEKNNSEKEGQNVKTNAVIRDLLITDRSPCSIPDGVPRVQETMNMSVNHTFFKNNHDSVPNEQKLPNNLGIGDVHPSEAEKQEKSKQEQMKTSLVPEQRKSLVRDDSPLTASERVATGDVVKEAPCENFGLKHCVESCIERPVVVGNPDRATAISKDNMWLSENEKTMSLDQKFFDKVPLRNTAPEQTKPSELMSLLEKKSLKLPEEVRTESSVYMPAKIITVTELKSSESEETSSISAQNEGNKSQNNSSAKDIGIEKPQSQCLVQTPPMLPEKETLNDSENVPAMSSVPEQPAGSVLEKTSLQEPVQEDCNTSYSKRAVTGKGWLELTTLRGMKKPSAKLTVTELSKPTPLSLSRSSVQDRAKMPANVSQEHQSRQSEDSHPLQSQDKTSNAMEVVAPLVSQKPLLIPDAKQLTTKCFSVFSSSDNTGELFAEKELKTYSRRVTPKKRKSVSISKEILSDRSSVVCKVLKRDNNAESRDVGDEKMETLNKTGDQVLNSQLSKDSQLARKSLKRQTSAPSGTKAKISRKKSTSKNNLPAKKAKKENSNHGNTVTVQNNSKQELRDEQSKLVDSVSDSNCGNTDNIQNNSQQELRGEQSNVVGSVNDSNCGNTDSIQNNSQQQLRSEQSKVVSSVSDSNCGNTDTIQNNLQLGLIGEQSKVVDSVSDSNCGNTDTIQNNSQQELRGEQSKIVDSDGDSNCGNIDTIQNNSQQELRGEQSKVVDSVSNSNCGNTDTIQNNSQQELRGEQSKVVDSVSNSNCGNIDTIQNNSQQELRGEQSKVVDSVSDRSYDNTIQNNLHLEFRGEGSKVVDSVSFVADQAIKDLTVNHSPTLKDVPGEQFDFFKPGSESLNHNSKERIREMTSIKKKLKDKEKRRRESKTESVASSAVIRTELVDGESLETVVDAVLDEKIAVIYNGEEHQENLDVNPSEIKEKVVKEEEKTDVVEKPKPARGRKKTEAETKEGGRGRRKRGKKQSENDGVGVSSNSEQFFLQDKVCAKFSHLPMCRECRDVHVEKTGLEFCRFNLFRRLKKRRNGKAIFAGFQLPEHAAPEDFSPWVAQDRVDMMDKNTSLYILSNVGDQFCSVMQEEKKAIGQAGENVSVSYKRAVQGVREMCDVCATTIFNMHWVCHRCGFGVCLDCYNLRVKERKEQPGLAGKRVFEFKWFMCCPGICHQPKYLSVAQIIPKTVLSDLGDELHRAREVWKIGETCPCKAFVSSEDNDSGAKITEISDDVKDKTAIREQEKELENNCKEEAGEVTGNLETGTAVVTSALPRSDLVNCDRSNLGKCDQDRSDRIARSGLDLPHPVTSAPANQNVTEADGELNFESLDDVNLVCDESLSVDSPTNHEQAWLTEEKRRNHFTKKAGFGLVEAKPRQKSEISSGLSLLMGYSSSAEGSPCESPAKSDHQSKTGAFDFPFVSGLDLLVLACEKNEGLSVLSNVTEDQNYDKQADNSKPEPQDKGKDKAITNVSNPVATRSECTSAESSDEVRQATPLVPDPSGLDPPMDAPHSWLCNGRLLRLLEPRAPGNVKAFEKRWKKGEPVLVSHVDKYMNLNLWTPEAFRNEFGSEIADVVNCRNGALIERFKVGDFWLGFESIKDRPLDSNGEPMLLKLKDWPPKDDFSEKLPTRFEDLMNNAPLPEYTRRDGSRNLVSRLPDFFVKPDLGPKMYNAYGSAACPKEGTTNLHLDMSDAVNVMVYVGVPKDKGAGEKEREDAIKAVDEACDESQQLRVRRETARIGALWHIYAAEDADKIRECLREVAKERRSKHPSHHDPIHDQCFYLDHDIRQRLKKDYGVEGWAICQCLGDAVFIPAGAPHQVRNLYSCVKVAEDFVSPERIDHCFKMTQEFRHLSDKHTNHEDKLQVKNVIYHAVKDALQSLQHYEKELTSTEEKRQKDA